MWWVLTPAPKAWFTVGFPSPAPPLLEVESDFADLHGITSDQRGEMLIRGAGMSSIDNFVVISV
jgi:hypothetical protein